MGLARDVLAPLNHPSAYARFCCHETPPLAIGSHFDTKKQCPRISSDQSFVVLQFAGPELHCCKCNSVGEHVDLSPVSTLNVPFDTKSYRSIACNHLSNHVALLARSMFEESCYHALYTRYYDITCSKTRRDRDDLTRLASPMCHRVPLRARTPPPATRTQEGFIPAGAQRHGVTGLSFAELADSPTLATGAISASWQCKPVNYAPASATVRHVCDCAVLDAATTLFSTARRPLHSPRPHRRPSPRAQALLASRTRRIAPKTRLFR